MTEELLFILDGLALIGAGLLAFAIYRFVYWLCHLVQVLLQPADMDTLLAQVEGRPSTTRWAKH